MKNLKYLYELRIKTDQERENIMLDNFKKYCENNEFSKALMFTGAWHRKSFILKIHEFNNKNELKINWVLDYF